MCVYTKRYIDPNLTEHPKFHCACTRVGKVLPSGIPYGLLADLYLPEEDPLTVQHCEIAFDDCMTKLIETSIKLTGNWDAAENTTTFTRDAHSHRHIPKDIRKPNVDAWANARKIGRYCSHKLESIEKVANASCILPGMGYIPGLYS